jgi:hypothetical protein
MLVGQYSASSDAEAPAIQAAPVQATTPEEAHLLLVTPLRVDGVDGDENAAVRLRPNKTLLSGQSFH